MTRGKHSTSSEARRAREASEREAERLAHETERLARLLETERAESKRAIDVLAAQIEVLRADAENGTSEKLDAALDEIDTLKERLVTQPQEILASIKSEIMAMRLPISSWTKIASAFGMKYGDFLEETTPGSGNRTVRRMTAKRANLNTSIRNDPSFIGD